MHDSALCMRHVGRAVAHVTFLPKAGQNASRARSPRDAGHFPPKRDCPAQSETVGQSAKAIMEGEQGESYNEIETYLTVVGTPRAQRTLTKELSQANKERARAKARAFCMGAWVPKILDVTGGALYLGGVPFFLRNFAWRCRISGGA